MSEENSEDSVADRSSTTADPGSWPDGLENRSKAMCQILEREERKVYLVQNSSGSPYVLNCRNESWSFRCPNSPPQVWVYTTEGWKELEIVWEDGDKIEAATQYDIVVTDDGMVQFRPKPTRTDRPEQSLKGVMFGAITIPPDVSGDHAPLAVGCAQFRP